MNHEQKYFYFLDVKKYGYSGRNTFAKAMTKFHNFLVNFSVPSRSSKKVVSAIRWKT